MINEDPLTGRTFPVVLDPEELAALLEVLDGTDFSFFQIEKEGTRVTLTRGNAAIAQAVSPHHTVQPTPAAPDVDLDSASLGTESRRDASGVLAVTGAGGASAPEPSPDENSAAIHAPMMGTFYAAPRPGEPNFVQVGDPVEPETVVAIIEVMKLMTSVTAGVSGVISETCVESGELVSFEQTLFRVKASS